MSRVRVHNFSVSLDGFGTGDGHSRQEPFGHASHRLHQWFFGTASFRAMSGNDLSGEQGGSTGIDDAFASSWGPGIGAEIMRTVAPRPVRAHLNSFWAERSVVSAPNSADEGPGAHPQDHRPDVSAPN